MPPRPLAGLRVLVTRPPGEGADEWAEALAGAGALPLAFPTVHVVPPASWQELDEALARLSSYHWLILTSQTAVAFVAHRLPGGRFPESLAPKIAVVGAKTALAVEQRGGQVARTPADPRQEGLVEVLGSLGAGTRVLLPLASGGRTLLAEKLRAQGCVVDVVTAYQTLAKPNLSPPPDFEVAVFASPSAVRAFVSALGKAPLDGKTVAVIGSTTAREAEQQGLRPVVARRPDVGALISAMTESRTSQGDPHVVP
jgi:uroporphyrinogen-III synthase